ncbi:MAG: hypothetical protein ACTHOE_00590 [Conexibacter sp.]
MLLLALTTADWAQVGSAFFTGLAALAAFATVFRIERERWKQGLPDLHIELLADLPNQEFRVSVSNHGGPAREVRIYGVVGSFGFGGLVGPTTHWRAGESRIIKVSMPPAVDVDEVYAFVDGRDMGKRYLFIGTVGGAQYRWRLRRAKRMSAEKEWRWLFPDAPIPIEAAHSPMAMETVERVI